jgi:hypothetical protein
MQNKYFLIQQKAKKDPPAGLTTAKRHFGRAPKSADKSADTAKIWLDWKETSARVVGSCPGWLPRSVCRAPAARFVRGLGPG